MTIRPLEKHSLGSPITDGAFFLLCCETSVTSRYLYKSTSTCSFRKKRFRPSISISHTVYIPYRVTSMHTRIHTPFCRIAVTLLMSVVLSAPSSVFQAPYPMFPIPCSTGEGRRRSEARTAPPRSVRHEDGDQRGVPHRRSCEGPAREGRRQHPGQRPGRGHRRLTPHYLSVPCGNTVQDGTIMPCRAMFYPTVLDAE